MFFGHRMGRANFTGTHPAFRFRRPHQSLPVAITDEEREQVEAECPKCQAPAGYWCLNSGGMPASVICPERVKAVSG